jgi:hypothetical protein
MLQQDENNELVASETDAFAIADFINVSPYLLSVRSTANLTFLYIVLFNLLSSLAIYAIGVHPWRMFTLMMYNRS